MNIYLGKHFEEFIREQVATGRYANASEVVREALRNLESDEEVRRLESRAFIQAGLDDLATGRVTRVDDLPRFLEQIRKEAHEEVLKLKEKASVNAAV